MSFKEARDERENAKKKLEVGIDPGEVRKAEKRTLLANAENSFEAVAREWHAKFSAELSPSHAERQLRRLEIHVFPYKGARPTVDVEPPEILDVLQRVERKGTLETAHRVRAIIGEVMRYAVVTAGALRDPPGD